MEPDLSYCPRCDRSITDDWWHDPGCPNRLPTPDAQERTAGEGDADV